MLPPFLLWPFAVAFFFAEPALAQEAPSSSNAALVQTARDAYAAGRQAVEFWERHEKASPLLPGRRVYHRTARAQSTCAAACETRFSRVPRLLMSAAMSLLDVLDPDGHNAEAVIHSHGSP